MRCINAIGDVQLQRNLPSDAETAYQDALQIAEQTANEKGIALAMNNLARCASFHGRTTDAIELYEKAALLFEKTHYLEGVAGVLKSLRPPDRR